MSIIDITIQGITHSVSYDLCRKIYYNILKKRGNQESQEIKNFNFFKI